MAAGESPGYEATAEPWGLPPDPRVVALHGPGMPRYANALIVARPADVEALQRLLACAYRAGYVASQADVRAALGLPRNPRDR